MDTLLPKLILSLCLVSLFLKHKVVGIDATTQSPIDKIDELLRSEFSDADSINSRLTHALLRRHTIKARPVTHPEEGVKVNVLCALYQIVDVDQRSNLATISAYFDLWWLDKFLQWNVSDYGGATQTYLPSEMVWTPDLYLYHSVQGSTPLAVQQSAVQITYDGTVRVFIPFTARALCTINVKYFPFDAQQCEFVFGSWSYRLDSVEYVVFSEDVLLSDFYDNQEWILTNSTLHKTTSLYTNSAFNETYSTVTLNVALQRQSFYYVFNLVLPVTLVTVVSVIGFHVPANSSERRESKFRLGIMTLLSMGVLLLNVVNDMPKFSYASEPGKRGSFSDVPLLGLFYVALIVIISVGTMSTGVFVALEKHALHHPADVPWWLRWLDFDWPNWSNIRRRHSEKIGRKRKTNQDKGSSGCCIENENLDKRGTADSCSATKALAAQLKSVEIEDDDDAAQVANVNCLSADTISRQASSSPKVVALNHANHLDRFATPPSYRRAILSPARRKVTPTKIDAETINSCKIGGADFELSVGLSKICYDILHEIRFIRESFDVERNDCVAAKSKLDPHRQQSLLTKSWSRVIHRFEALSLIIYLCLVGTALFLFFVYSWY